MHPARVLRLDCGLTDLAAVRTFVRRVAAELGIPLTAITDLEIAVDEAVTNIVEHGYGGRPGPVEIEIARSGDQVRVHLRDEAIPFDPTRVADPDLTIPLERRPPGGLGIHLTRSSVDRVSHRAGPARGNELTLEKSVAGMGGQSGEPHG